MPIHSYQRIDVEAVDTQPLPKQPTLPRTIIDPDDHQGNIQIPVDKTRYRIRFLNETEHYADVVIEPK